MLAAGLVAFAAAASAEPEFREWKGGATPRLSLPASRGAPVDLAKLRGRVVLVNFWATWCEPCREELPSFARLRERLAGQPFEVLAVNYGEPSSRVAAFVDRHGVAIPVLLDEASAVAKAWGVKGLPTTYLVDAKGRIRVSVFGELDWNSGEGAKRVEALLAEAAKTMPAKKP